jgi:hypothetical protein
MQKENLKNKKVNTIPNNSKCPRCYNTDCPYKNDLSKDVFLEIRAINFLRCNGNIIANSPPLKCKKGLY